jgi:hypothetical protein
MKILSINVRGLGGQAKKLTLKQMVEANNPMCYLSRKTMGMGDPFIRDLKKIYWCVGILLHWMQRGLLEELSLIGL